MIMVQNYNFHVRVMQVFGILSTMVFMSSKFFLDDLSSNISLLVGLERHLLVFERQK